MLSKVANRVYWMGRALERAENIARLLAVYDGLLLDLPPDAELGPGELLVILGVPELTAKAIATAGDRAMLHYLVADADNPSSLLASLSRARENARTSRDVFPNEAWRAVNELFLYARERLPRMAARRQRFDEFKAIVSHGQQITGLLSGTMSHGPAYQFLRMGRNLERADMTTRVIDVAAAILLSGRPGLARYDNTLWMAVLRSLSAYQMYRQYVRRRIVGTDVITFLLHDQEFPRAVRHCLRELRAALTALPKHESSENQLQKVIARLGKVRADALDHAALHQLIDELQLDFAALDRAIRRTWFSPDLAA